MKDGRKTSGKVKLKRATGGEKKRYGGRSIAKQRKIKRKGAGDWV